MNAEEKEKAVAYLEQQGCLEYGYTIPKECIEVAIGVKFKESWDFLGPFLQLKQTLEEQGYLSTSENINPGSLRIFGVDEVSYRSDLIFKNIVKKMKRLQSCLINAKAADFDHEEYMKHLHVSNKVSTGLNSLLSSLSSI
jgi:hypothetical protein